MNQLGEHETETLLRESMDRLAARAPDGYEIRAALADARPVRARPRLALVGVAAAVIAVAVGASVGITALNSAPSPEPLTAAAPSAEGVLQYAPGRLPDGFTEQYREAGVRTAPQIRRWLADGGTREITLSAYSTADPQWSQTALRIASLPDQILVRGRVGMVTGGGADSALLTWMADPARVLTLKLTHVPDARETGQQIADSVSTGVDTRLSGEIRFGHLPDGLHALSESARGTSPQDGSSEVKAATGGEPTIPALRAGVGPGSPDLTGASTARVRGTSGFYRAPAQGADGLAAVRLP
ncbi:hypothetical protein, partial [Amycolatopsis sp. H20-H5]|uniref:hypothetical protein n=1 Tax=Amycolatopsis sp. H20-H5 TaxID=3046309 RepID=UPI002DB97BAC